MDKYLHSIPVDSEVAKSRGCITTIPIRQSNFNNEADVLGRKFIANWIAEVAPVNEWDFCAHPLGDLCSFAYPETLPERIHHIAELTATGFLQDDFIDEVDFESAKPFNSAWADGYGLQDVYSTNVMSTVSKKRQIQAKLLCDAIKTDRESGMLVLNTYTDLYAQKRREMHKFKSFDDFVEYRFEDVGVRVGVEIALFGAGFKVTPAEKQELWPHLSRFLFAVEMNNDYWSFDKEHRAYISSNGAAELTNCVWFIMNHQNVGILEAKEILRQKMVEVETTFLEWRVAYSSKNNVTDRMNKYMDICMWIHSGSSYWSSFGYRYNKKPSPETTASIEPAISEATVPGDLENGREHIENEETSNTTKYASLEIASSANKTMPRSVTSRFTDQKTENLHDSVVLEPFEYLVSLPSKGVREIAIDAINFWLNVPSRPLEAIKRIIKLLHSSSLMLDDIEDQSPLRRGHPSTHVIFGEAQTINSANYLFACSMEELQKLRSPQALCIFGEELKNLHIGQSYDLYWTHGVVAPTEAQYIEMVDNKTGGLFRLLGRLMNLDATTTHANLNMEHFCTLIGRYFQIRDDYQNLVSEEYEDKKGFCEDLDEGKYSLLLIHVLSNTEKKKRLESLLQERRKRGNMTIQMKTMVQDMMEDCGTFEYVLEVLQELQDAVEKEMDRIEALTGTPNYVLRLLIERLRL